MGMFTAAFDASGHESDRLVMVVAGFVSSAKDWQEFSKQWKARLEMDGLEYFHLEEFAGWRADEVKIKRPLQRDLMELIKKYTYRKFGLVVLPQEFSKTISQEMRDFFHLNAYSFAGMNCVTQVDEWARRDRVSPATIEYVFEQGDIGEGKLTTAMQNSGFSDPLFRPGKKDLPTPCGNIRPAFVPLQAADWLAGELFWDMERIYKRAEKRTSPRWGFQQFQTKVGEIRYTQAEGIKDLQTVMNAGFRTLHLKNLKGANS